MLGSLVCGNVLEGLGGMASFMEICMSLGQRGALRFRNPH